MTTIGPNLGKYSIGLDSTKSILCTGLTSYSGLSVTYGTTSLQAMTCTGLTSSSALTVSSGNLNVSNTPNITGT